MNTFFSSILGASGELTFFTTVLCSLASLLCGAIAAFIYTRLQKHYSRNFMVTLVILPLLVQCVIMLVNGNLGTGVAIVGAFSLIRFRSVPGNSRDIMMVFFVMSIGLATGMGYLAFAGLITLIASIVILFLSKIKIGVISDNEKRLRILIPENLDYTTVFDDIFEKYFSKCEMLKTKTTNLGSMFELDYAVVQKNPKSEKEMIDAIRCRNGNLMVALSRPETNYEEL